MILVKYIKLYANFHSELLAKICRVGGLKQWKCRVLEFWKLKIKNVTELQSAKGIKRA